MGPPSCCHCRRDLAGKLYPVGWLSVDTVLSLDAWRLDRTPCYLAAGQGGSQRRADGVAAAFSDSIKANVCRIRPERTGGVLISSTSWLLLAERRCCLLAMSETGVQRSIKYGGALRCRQRWTVAQSL